MDKRFASLYLSTGQQLPAFQGCRDAAVPADDMRAHEKHKEQSGKAEWILSRTPSSSPSASSSAFSSPLRLDR
jgi:hypothetical protein